MFKSLTRTTLFGILFTLPVLTTDAYSEPMTFSYTFEGDPFPPEPYTWGTGATLTGEIDGTIDPLNPDRVIINSFGSVVLTRPGLPDFEYDAIDASEFLAVSQSDAVPVMSFSGTVLDFISCPEGFTDDSSGDGVLDECPFGIAPGGGFLIDGSIGLATAADGSADEVCVSADPAEQRRIDGCRVADRPFVPENWSLIRPDGDGDGVPDGDDFCADTAIPEGVPTVRLRPNRWALIDDDSEFDTVIKGNGKEPNRSYIVEDTAGCSCEQIIEMQGLGIGHTYHGCSIGAMDNWVELVTP